MRLNFDQDYTKPNPYEEPRTCEYPKHSGTSSHTLIFVVGTTETLKQRLDEDEKHELLQGRTPPHHICQHCPLQRHPDRRAAVCFPYVMFI